MARGRERILSGRPAARRRHRAAELAVIQRGIDGSEIMFDVEGELAVLETGAGGAVIRLEAVIEYAFQIGAAALDVETEGNGDAVMRQYRIPAAIDGGSAGLRECGPAAGGEKRDKTGGLQKRFHGVTPSHEWIEIAAVRCTVLGG